MDNVDWKGFHQHARGTRGSLLKGGKKPDGGGGSGGGGGGGGSGKMPNWKLRQQYFKPGKLPVKIRLLPGPEGMWTRYYSRFLQVLHDGKLVKRNIISNSQNGELEVPDLLYYYAITLQKPEYMAGPSDVTTVLVLDDFHEIEKGKSKHGDPYYSYERCMGKNRFNQSACKLCDDKVPKVFGRRQHMTLWANQRKQFEDELASLPGRCYSCHRGEISVYGYRCASCGHELASHYTAPIPPEHEAELREKEVTCPKCGVVALAASLIECVVRHGEGDKVSFTEGCDKPKEAPLVANPWDYDLTVVEEKVGNNSRIIVTDFEPCRDYQLPPDLTQPFDFSFFQYMSLDEQAKEMGRPNVFGPEAQKALEEFFAPKPAAPNQPDRDSIPWGRR